MNHHHNSSRTTTPDRTTTPGRTDIPSTPAGPTGSGGPGDRGDRGVADVFAVLTAGLAGPVGVGVQAQGDVLVQPWPVHVAPAVRAAAVGGGALVPAGGVPVLVGAGGHAHTLYTDPVPAASWTPGRPRAGTLGVLVVPAGGTAVLGHHEHPDLRVGPGVYALRRQRTHTLPTTTPAAVARPVPDPGTDWALD
jgi:hypothetical protein